jgi:hypothetical protein
MIELLVPCPYCGLTVRGGWEWCHALKTEDGLKEASEPAYGRFRRLRHDTYCVQQEERYCGRTKGLISHLGGLYVGIEYARHPNVDRALQRWLDRGHWRAVTYPPSQGIPTNRGDLTIADAQRAIQESPEAYGRVVERWAHGT